MPDTLRNPHLSKPFLRRLSETIAWCSRAARIDDPKTSLRTFKPPVSDLSPPAHQIFTVELGRGDRLRSVGQADTPIATNLHGGKLLAYFPDDTLSDGVAEAESGGFFDADNIPPYDTWVWMVERTESFRYKDGKKGRSQRNYLIAWVPPLLVPLAGRGIDANVELCIQWLDQLDDPFAKSVRRLKLAPA